MTGIFFSIMAPERRFLLSQHRLLLSPAQKSVLILTENTFYAVLPYAVDEPMPSSAIFSKNISPQIVRTAEALCKKKTKGIWVLPYEPGDMPDVHSDSFLFVKREVEG